MPHQIELPDTVAPAGLPARAGRGWLERLWSSIAERGRSFAAIPASSIDPVERARLLAQSLLSGRGEASGAAVARELLAVLGTLSKPQRGDFLLFLAQQFQPDPRRLADAAEAYLKMPDADHAARLADCAEPPRQELLRRMNMAPGGTAALIDIRKQIPEYQAQQPSLALLDTDLRHLLVSWFNRGFLELRRIDWQTPAAVLEKLITYEAVHEIKGWEDLRRRLAADRRCFAFFHPALPGEPLIFVEVALVNGLAGSIQPLLDHDADAAEEARRAQEADTAIFYSISNCQDGLRGISFGNFLIKQVVEELRTELPGLQHFATLSPVPGFRRWLEARLQAEASPQPLLTEPEGRALDRAAGAVAGAAEPAATLRDVLSGDSWAGVLTLNEALRPVLLRLCATYLTTRPGQDKRIDPVARFHLGNGAQLERVNWMGNPGPRGLRESYGIMVNYLYDPALIEANHEGFAREGRVARAAAVDALLMQTAPALLPWSMRKKAVV